MERKYIMHLDGDSFFVSVEAAKDPSLRGKPVVSGYERGIASAMSYEAKKLGITRGMPVFQIRKLFPQTIVVSSDYESYAVFSRRMIDIVKRYTDRVEEYSIDECFADFSQMKSFIENPWPILEKIKSDIRRELGITVSLGLGPTKVIAKTASKRNKPDGLTVLEPQEVPLALSKTPVDSVWGIGSATAFALRKKGVATALDLALKPRDWVAEHFSKPMIYLWYELNCISMMPVVTSSDQQKSIMKTRTFSPSSNSKSYVFSELSKNIENAARKAREMKLVAGELSIYLKTSSFTYKRNWCKLAVPTNEPFEIIQEARKLYESLFSKGTEYRATGTTLHALMPETAQQENLFGDMHKANGRREVVSTVDKINKKYGRSVIHIASSDMAIRKEEKSDKKPGYMPKGFWKRLSIPYLGEVF
jgi:DNA polymerase-4/DNA polymerase V